MRKILFIFFVLTAKFSFSQSTYFEEIKITYYNEKDNKVQEFIRVGDGYWNKPQIFDVNIKFTEMEPKGKVEVLIEELQAPSNRSKYDNKFALRDTSWVLAKVIYGGIIDFNKSKELIINDVEYKTAYYEGSDLYSKLGFRITACFRNDNYKIVDILSREYVDYY